MPRLSPHYQHTIQSSVRLGGVGVHTGRSINLEIAPAGPGDGIVFSRADIADRDPNVPARADLVCDTRLGTVIANAAGARVATVEHLMAALWALGVDNARIEIDGPEVPIMDGSCEPFLSQIGRVGLRLQPLGRRYIEILEPVVVDDGEKRAALVPADRFEMAFEIRFESSAIGRQSIDLPLDPDSFRRDLADSRTFGFLHEVEALRAAGLARGGTMDNVVVIDGDSVLNPGGLRRPDEFVRHKAIDAVGDLYLLGAPLIGRYEGRYAGHALNNALARALLDRPSAWRATSAPDVLARAV